MAENNIIEDTRGKWKWIRDEVIYVKLPYVTGENKKALKEAVQVEGFKPMNMVNIAPELCDSVCFTMEEAYKFSLKYPKVLGEDNCTLIKGKAITI